MAKIDKFRISIIESNIIYIAEQIDITDESGAECSRQVIEKAKKLKNDKFLLIDLTDSEMPPPKARKAYKKMVQVGKFKKIAIFGAITSLRVMAKFITRAGGLSNLDFFKTKEEALVWLKK